MKNLPPYLTSLLSLLPSILFFGGALYLSSKFPIINYLFLLVFPIGFGYLYFTQWKSGRLLKAISEGDLPQLLADHPVCETSKDEYRLVRERIEEFVSSVEQGEVAEVSLTTQEINCLQVRGVTPKKTDITNIPKYFNVIGDEIQEFSIMFFPFFKGGFQRETYSIRFTKNESNHLDQTRVMTSVNGKVVSQPSGGNISISQSELIDSILRMDKTLAWAESMAVVIERLTEVKVEDSKLILKADCEVEDIVEDSSRPLA